MAQTWIVNFNAFYWGMSDTDTLMSTAQYPYSHNADVTKDPDFIQISRRPELQVSTTDLILAWVEFKWNLYFFWKSGIIYDTWWLVDTLIGNYDIFTAIVFDGSVFFFYRFWSEIRIGEFDWTSIVNTNVVLNLPIPYTATTDYCAPVTNIQEDFVYVWGSNAVYRLTRQPWGLFAELWVQLESTVTGITSVWNLLKVYLNNGRIYYWDWFSEAIDTYQETNTKVNYVYDDGSVDYVFAWASTIYAEMHVSQWLELKLMKKRLLSKWAENNNKFAFTATSCNHAVTKYQNVYYTATREDEWTPREQIVAFWTEYNGFPFFFNNILDNNSSGDYMDDIWMVFSPVGWPSLWYSWENWSWFGIDRLELSPDISFASPLYNDESVIYSPKYVIDHNEIKRAVNMDIRADTNDTWQNIEILYSLDGEPYQSLVTVAGVDTYRKETKNRKIIKERISDDFYEIQFKFILRTNNTSLSPKLYDFRLLYEINER